MQGFAILRRPPALASDFDGDGRADLGLFRPSTGQWLVAYAYSTFTVVNTLGPWGTVGDVPVAADYDGDGRAELAVYRPTAGAWYILLSTTGYGAGQILLWGTATDVPVPADYNGDGRADVAVFREATGVWYVRNQFVVKWGQPGDVAALRP